MKSQSAFLKMIKDLPEADIPFEGVRGWLFQGVDRQVVFFDIQPVGKIPEHSHGEQWGMVLEGEMELVINGAGRIYQEGDWYHVPAGASHAASFRTRTWIMDVFADPNRYRAKSGSSV